MEAVLLVPTVDSDGDGLSDPEESEWGLDPQVSDTDGDGIGDVFEISCGFEPGSPDDPDSDGDGILDSMERHGTGTAPNQANTWYAAKKIADLSVGYPYLSFNNRGDLSGYYYGAKVYYMAGGEVDPASGSSITQINNEGDLVVAGRRFHIDGEVVEWPGHYFCRINDHRVAVGCDTNWMMSLYDIPAGVVTAMNIPGYPISINNLNQVLFNHAAGAGAYLYDAGTVTDLSAFGLLQPCLKQDGRVYGVSENNEVLLWWNGELTVVDSFDVPDGHEIASLRQFLCECGGVCHDDPGRSRG